MFKELVFKDVLEKDLSGSAKYLVVVLHGLQGSSEGMAGVKAVVREVVGAASLGGVDIYAPELPYSSLLDSTGANDTVRHIVAYLDDICSRTHYEHVVFIGHSMGGALLRRVFLTGAPHPPDYSGPYATRDDLSDAAAKDADLHALWASKVERLVLLASWNKGWSVSDRGGWWSNFWLDVLGFVGRVQTLLGDRQLLGRTMLDLRRGSAFIVQTRLLWMAYRRWHIPDFRKHYAELGIDQQLIDAGPPQGAINPLLVQVLGTRDDFVSPQDQVDTDADGNDWTLAAQQARRERLYYLMEVPTTNHNDIVDFGSTETDSERTEAQRIRKDVLAAALKIPRSASSPSADTESLSTTSSSSTENLFEYVRNPTYFADRPTPIDDKVENVVFIMHGIRDNGYWTPRIAKAVKETAKENTTTPNATAPRLPLDSLLTLTPTYGYFPMGSFIMPWVRQQKVEWFMDHYVDVKSRYPKATMHYVGHSNGTYLAAKALRDYKAARFGRIYFAGSVVHPTFDWKKMVEDRRIGRFHNARGAYDWIVALFPKSLEYFSDLGGGGFDGFEQVETDSAELTQSEGFATSARILDGHGGAIREDHWEEIGKFIVTGAKPFATTEQTSGLFAEKPHPCIAWLARWRIGIPAGFTIVALLVLFAVSLWGAVPPCDGDEGSHGLPGWGYGLWLVGLALFLWLQYKSPQAPRGRSAMILTSLLVILTAGFALFVGSSLLATFCWSFRYDPTGGILAFVGLAGSASYLGLRLSRSNALPGWRRTALLSGSLVALGLGVLDFLGYLSPAGRAIGAVLTLVALAAMIRFVLKRF